jgi:hypothetical protein
MSLLSLRMASMERKSFLCFFAALAVELHDLLISSQKLHPRYLPAHLFS